MVIEPGIPDAVRRMFLRLPEEFALSQPTQPTKLFSKDQPLPDASLYAGHVMFDKTLNAPVWSDGSNWNAF